MKAKLVAVVVLFFALSIVAWSYVPGETAEPGSKAEASAWPEFPSCTGRDRGDGGEAAKPGVSSGRQTLTPQENPLETSFRELTCLLASN